MRAALVPVFQAQHLQQYVLRMIDIVRDHLSKEWTPVRGTNKTRICVRDEMEALTVKIIAQLVLGLDLDEDRETIQELKELFMEWLGGLFMPAIQIPGTPFMSALKAPKQIKEILLPVIQQRRESAKRNTIQVVIDIMLDPTKDNPSA
jgi:cytochrome P450